MERLTARITGEQDIRMPLVPERLRRQILGQFAGTDMARPEAQLTMEDDSEERSARASSYLEKNLGSPDTSFAQLARKGHINATLATFLVVMTSVSTAVLLVYFPIFREVFGGYVWAFTVFFSILAATSKALQPLLVKESPTAAAASSDSGEISKPDASPIYWLVRSNRLTTLAALFGVTGALLFGCIQASTILIQESRPVLVVVGLSILGLVAEGIDLGKQFAKTAARFSKASMDLQREVRMYANLYGPYDAQTDSAWTWKQFLRRVDNLVEMTNEPNRVRASDGDMSPRP
jgi:hypothetical protein